MSAAQQDSAAGTTEDRGQRKVRTGIVTSDRMDKTVVVQIIQTIRHPLYPKIYRRRKSLYAHDEANAAKVGDRVRVMETRPMSKQKRWRVVEILERAK
ncbi:MAG TPA: 30S ribosomal protein S17 [Actinomycetota bacterium]|nr:30S ribosomal protein S17 [Actinomycetota bacterium]